VSLESGVIEATLEKTIADHKLSQNVITGSGRVLSCAPMRVDFPVTKRFGMALIGWPADHNQLVPWSSACAKLNCPMNDDNRSTTIARTQSCVALIHPGLIDLGL